MTNKKTFKFSISTLVIIVLVAILSVSCKKKPTSPVDSSVGAGTEEVINGAEDTVDGKDTTDDKDTIKDGTFSNGYFRVTVKHPEIRIEYKDFFGGQGSLIIKAEGKSKIKGKNSIFGFNFIIDGVTLLATDATPNYDANGNLVSIVFSSKYTGKTKEVRF